MRNIFPLLALCLAATLSPLACQDNSDAPATPTPTPTTSATPTPTPTTMPTTDPPGKTVLASSCKYQVAPRPEYTEVFMPKTPEEALGGSTTEQPNIRRVRLGLGGNVRPDASDRPDPSTSVAIAWETDEKVTASLVEYGTSEDPKSWDQRVYGFSYVVAPPDKGLGKSNLPQQLHEVHLCGLSPSTTYYYRVGGGPKGQEVWSEVLSFRTTPAADADEEVTIAVTGDSRGNNNNAWQILQERLYKRGDITAQVFSGDMVDLAFDQKAYETWLDGASRDTAGKPAMLGQVLTLITMGNHEFYNAQFFSAIVQPQDPTYDRKYDELFFSTNIGPIHFIVLDDQRVGEPGTDTGYAPLLIDWLHGDLKAVDREKHPWIAVVHHRSEFSSANHGADPDVIDVRKALMPVWDEHKVNLVLAGHDHNYERSKPLRDVNDLKIGEGTRYIVCAGSGAEPYGNSTSDFTEVSQTYNKDKGTIGVYGILKATRAKLSFTAHHLTPDNTDAQIDQFELP